VRLLVAFSFFFKRGLSMGIEAGGYGAYNLAARQTLSGPDGDHGGSIRNGISKLDLGAVLGLELAKKMGKGELVLNLRFQEGLANINKSAPYYPEMRNRIIALLLGYRFGR